MTAEAMRGLLQGALEYAKFPTVQVVADSEHRVIFLKGHDVDTFSVELKDGSRFAVIVHAIPSEWAKEIKFLVKAADWPTDD